MEKNEKNEEKEKEDNTSSVGGFYSLGHCVDSTTEHDVAV